MDLNFFKGETISIKRKLYTTEFNDFGTPQFIESLIEVNALLYFRKSDSRITPYEIAIDTDLTIIMPYGTVTKDSDIFVIRGEEWETDSIPMPLAYQNQYDYFMKPPVILSLKQHKGNVGQ